MIHLTLPGSIRTKKTGQKVISMPKYKESLNKHFWPKMGWQFCYHQIIPGTPYEKWEPEARLAVRTQLPLGFRIITESVSVKMLAYFKGAKPDLSGCEESIGDALEGLVWENDRQIASWDGSMCIHDLKNPRTEVWVDEFKDSL